MAMAHDLGPPRAVCQLFGKDGEYSFVLPRGKSVRHRATRPRGTITLSTRQEGLVRPMMVWAHDLRCIPTSLANKNPAADNSRGCYRRENFVPPAVTTSPIDSPFDRRGRH